MNEVHGKNNQGQAPLAWMDRDPILGKSIDLANKFDQATVYKKFETVEIRFDKDLFYVKDLHRGVIYPIAYEEATVKLLKSLREMILQIQQTRRN